MTRAAGAGPARADGRPADPDEKDHERGNFEEHRATGGLRLSEREAHGDPESPKEEEAHLDAPGPRRGRLLGAVPILDEAHAEQQQEPNHLRRHVTTNDVHRVELLARWEDELRVHAEG